MRTAGHRLKPSTVKNCFHHCRIRTVTEVGQSDDESAEIEVDQAAVKDFERTYDLLRTRRPEIFVRRLKINDLLNDDEGDFVDTLEVNELGENALVRADLEEVVKEEEMLPDSSSDEPLVVSKQEATSCLFRLRAFLQEQDKDMGPELAMIRRLLDYIKSTRILNLEQTNIHSYFLKR
jgi:hypothetical protein